jgi:hypothetical protein
MNSASLCSLAGLYDNPIPTRFLAPIDCLKIPALNMVLHISSGHQIIASCSPLIRHLQVVHPRMIRKLQVIHP